MKMAIQLLITQYAINVKNALLFAPKQHLKWLHIVVSNAKAFILGTYHGLDSLHIQSYLDEFCFPFNRRFFSTRLFNRIVNACAFSSPTSYSELIR
jgi:hypothetical protein